MARALKEAREQCAIHTHLTEAIRLDDSDRLDATIRRVVNWEADNTRPSPYHVVKERKCFPSIAVLILSVYQSNSA